MNNTSWVARLKSLPLRWSQTQASPEDAIAYQNWRQRFMRQRIRLALYIAILANLTFILLRLLLGAESPEGWSSIWLMTSISVEAGLLTCLGLHRTKWGRHHPELIFLGCSWSITLVEQVWATLQNIAFPGLFAWTLVFLAQATLVPVRWPLHLISQIGVFLYFIVVNAVLNLPTDSAETLWDPIRGLYLFWFCCICDGSVFLYERLQQAEFYARRELEVERAKSERLLLNILPEAIAHQLKQDQRTIAENFAEVTVLFADIVGFTRLSSGIPAQELVNLLNQIFSTFDQLAERHGLEKIKTIGDAYMVVGGLPKRRDDHVEAIADMALDMQQAIAQFKTQQNEIFSIRIGINTGPVVAGVIGRKKFIYDLWGDTVNVASRMESQGLAGRIQVTAAVYDRLKQHYSLEERGTVYIKGKGDMATYLLRGKQNSPAPDAACSV